MKKGKEWMSMIKKGMINDDTSWGLEVLWSLIRCWDWSLMLGLISEFILMHALGGASTSLGWDKMYIPEYRQTQPQPQTYLSIYNGKKIKLDYTKCGVCQSAVPIGLTD
jgi:hypothetical protein